MPEILSEAITIANAAGIHVALVDGDEISFSYDGRSQRFATPETSASQLLNIAAGGTFDGEIDDRLAILCCTDSKQDPCCARYGFATWKALKELADPRRFRVLQSTHLGGCRFAASLLVLPLRQRYGRLEPRNVPDFLESISRGVPFLPAYRGNPTLDPAAQVAEHAALSFAALQGIAADVGLYENAVPARATGEALFMATVSSLSVRIRLEQLRYEVNTRCSTIKAGSGETADRWRVVSVEPLD
ncbi:hypothetical protein QFZ34_001299 [Phyllobacterium ifriqiyense]|uniref:Sucrase ferredoxin n=1 Tax=Phyllobacterium ifriqiyense TaxID=314238 RepID=A0ABU0S5U5_9HYPH|nr:sucrase ferredoxin [Phyllobacterium ifriqiyense]MDQ0996122.1 hypothetical protein [Phyllobacterium ifriqiyense]